ncbi:hypothetical protein KIPB_004257 [Kipferlia bialata]|uniref:Uncharacterized protein n=1 Tax=Kipferlia bialata TaxID=797122 RepID=A0A9K3CWR1_9EUKA|nr:hypothetical protein KIPB_004257 [Kipferlia bialata]|eukprot:g4257.t1
MHSLSISTADSTYTRAFLKNWNLPPLSEKDGNGLTYYLSPVLSLGTNAICLSVCFNRDILRHNKVEFPTPTSVSVTPPVFKDYAVVFPSCLGYLPTLYREGLSYVEGAPGTCRSTMLGRHGPNYNMLSIRLPERGVGTGTKEERESALEVLGQVDRVCGPDYQLRQDVRPPSPPVPVDVSSFKYPEFGVPLTSPGLSTAYSLSLEGALSDSPFGNLAGDTEMTEAQPVFTSEPTKGYQRETKSYQPGHTDMYSPEPMAFQSMGPHPHVKKEANMDQFDKYGARHSTYSALGIQKRDHPRGFGVDRALKPRHDAFIAHGGMPDMFVPKPPAVIVAPDVSEEIYNALYCITEGQPIPIITGDIDDWIVKYTLFFMQSSRTLLTTLVRRVLNQEPTIRSKAVHDIPYHGRDGSLNIASTANPFGHLAKLCFESAYSSESDSEIMAKLGFDPQDGNYIRCHEHPLYGIGISKKKAASVICFRVLLSLACHVPFASSSKLGSHIEGAIERVPTKVTTLFCDYYKKHNTTRVAGAPLNQEERHSAAFIAAGALVKLVGHILTRRRDHMELDGVCGDIVIEQGTWKSAPSDSLFGQYSVTCPRRPRLERMVTVLPQFFWYGLDGPSELLDYTIKEPENKL